MDYTVTVPVSPETRLILDGLTHLEGILLATQAQIDALTGRIGTAVADIRADIATIKAQHPEVDISALEAKVAGLEGLAAENPPPAPSGP